eukprot:TsM_000894900 transcript=TsM_000894900 gene=TsM_000894900
MDITGATRRIVPSIFRAATENVWSPNGGRRFFASTLSLFTSGTIADFHQLGCAGFIQRMRQNLIERNSEADFDEMLSLYRRFQSGERDLQSRLEQLYLSLPNFSHPSTPVGDLSKFRLLYLHGSPKLSTASNCTIVTSYFEVPQPKNEVELLSNEAVPHRWGKQGRRTGHGTLRSSGALVAGYGPRAYAFYDSLAVLEAALLQLTLDRTRKAGFQLIAVPDILLSSVIQRCGFPTTGDRNQVFNVAERKESAVGNGALFSLSGTAEMGIAGFCADRAFGGVGTADAEFFCAVSRCYRHEIAPQESLLYRTHQFTKVEIFCVAKPSPEVGDRVFERIVEFQKKLYSDLELHFRVLEMPTSELGNPAHRKIDIEAFMPGEGIFGEVTISSTSNCTDYQAIRLNILWKQDSAEERHPYAYTLNGTGCAVTRILKALVETHQNSDGTIDIPRILWPYMNGIRRLQVEESPLITS